MEEYIHENSSNSHRVSLLYAPSSSSNKNDSDNYESGFSNQQHIFNTFLPQSIRSDNDQPGPVVKSEGSSSKFNQFSMLMRASHNQQEGNNIDNNDNYSNKNNSNNNEGRSSSSPSNEVEMMKAKIIAHPQYANLLEAYLECQKIGAPPEGVDKLMGAWRQFESRQPSSLSSRNVASRDPELDQFMEAYCDMLVKYREELTRPIQEAMDFISRVEAQLSMLCQGPLHIFNNSDEKCQGLGSSDEDQDKNSNREKNLPEIDPRAEDRELKNHLLRKYSGYLSSLKQELSKKKKKGKLPKEARQKLHSWWDLHFKWPYPSESEKAALAESTGLDQKQINNWFINQRKRHWKPSDDMQFMVMDGVHPQNAALYMDARYMADGSYRLGP